MNDKRDAVPDKYILASNIEKLGNFLLYAKNEYCSLLSDKN